MITLALSKGRIFEETLPLLAAAGIDWKSYARRVGERPSAQKVNADRKADQAAKA